MWRALHALLLLATVSHQMVLVFGYKAKYERFEQFFGKEYLDCDLRVRKYNRTTTALNGTLHIRRPMDDRIVFSSDVFLSRLGNQQFQHYPMHLPTSGYCQFMDNVHTEFPATIQDIVNISSVGECPVSERTMLVDDLLFPPDVLPDTLSPGLWKMVISGTLDEEVVIRMMVSIRLYDDHYN